MQLVLISLANAVQPKWITLSTKALCIAGTFPMQSERFYAALKGHGAPCKLVILPHESHGYRARESVMHTLHEMDQWLQRFCEQKQDPVSKL